MARTFLILFVAISLFFAGMAGYSSATQYVPPPVYIIAVLVIIVVVTARLYIGDAAGVNAFFRFLAKAIIGICLSAIPYYALVIAPNQIPPGRITIPADMIAVRIGLEKGAFPDGFKGITVSDLANMIAVTIPWYPEQIPCATNVAQMVKTEGHLPADETDFLRRLDMTYQACKTAGADYQEKLQFSRFNWSWLPIGILIVTTAGNALLTLILKKVWGNIAPYVSLVVVYGTSISIVALVMAPTNHAAALLGQIFFAGLVLGSLLELVLLGVDVFIGLSTKKLASAEKPKLSFGETIFFALLGAVIGIPWIQFQAWTMVTGATRENFDVPLTLAVTSVLLGVLFAQGMIKKAFDIAYKGAYIIKASD